MGALGRQGARVRAQAWAEVSRDPGSHGGHGAQHLAPRADGGDQEAGGPRGRDGNLQDGHHPELPQEPQH